MILLTPTACRSAGYTLGVYCRVCSVVRDVDLSSLPEKAIGEMRFRCSQCGELGQPQVMGWSEGERRTWS